MKEIADRTKLKLIFVIMTFDSITIVGVPFYNMIFYIGGLHGGNHGLRKQTIFHSKLVTFKNGIFCNFGFGRACS